MLDRPTYNDPEPRQALKCEACLQEFSYEDDQENWEHIDNTGMCLHCNKQLTK